MSDILEDTALHWWAELRCSHTISGRKASTEPGIGEYRKCPACGDWFPAVRVLARNF